MTKHVLWTVEEHSKLHETDPQSVRWERDSCPVCDWGLGVCKICGAAEADLYEYDTCKKYQEWQTANNFANKGRNKK